MYPIRSSMFPPIWVYLAAMAILGVGVFQSRRAADKTALSIAEERNGSSFTRRISPNWPF